jgi:hypothetical protein
VRTVDRLRHKLCNSVQRARREHIASRYMQRARVPHVQLPERACHYALHIQIVMIGREFARNLLILRDEIVTHCETCVRVTGVGDPGVRARGRGHGCVRARAGQYFPWTLACNTIVDFDAKLREAVTL